MNGSNIWNVAEPGTIEVPGPVRALEVSLVRGRVDVVAGDGPGARVEIHELKGRPLEVSLDGGMLKVRYRGSLVGGIAAWSGGRGGDTADVQVTVPAEVSLTLGVAKADGFVAGLRGRVKLSTVSGPVVVDQCSGPLEVSTVSGDVVVRDHTGDVTASGVSGELTISGDVPVLEASTVSGDLTADLSSTPRHAELSGVSSDVVLRVPDTDLLALRLNAASGRIVVDGAEHTDVRHKGLVIDRSGTTGKVTINVVSGDLTVLSSHAADAGADRPEGGE